MTADERALAQRVIAELEARGLLPLLREICAARGITEIELCSRRRTRSVALARQELWWRIRVLPDRCYSLLEIAAWFHRGHSTVLHGIAALERRLLAAQPSSARASPLTAPACIVHGLNICLAHRQRRMLVTVATPMRALRFTRTPTSETFPRDLRHRRS